MGGSWEVWFIGKEGKENENIKFILWSRWKPQRVGK